jgi:hypothetical protein
MQPSTQSPHAAESPNRWWPFACAGLAYSALAIALTFPLILHLSSTVPHDVGDPLLSTSIFWWNAHVLPFTDRWWNGLAFFPAPGFLALSDPRLGLGLLATPLQWLGCSPVTAYNVTLLATFSLSALAAHWLGFVLTRRHDAAAIGGLAFGFCPFRVAHLPHLELLAAFGMPVALVALHQFLRTRRPRWMVVFAVALTVQGYCSSYYLLFFSVFVGLWLLWFIRRDDLAVLAGIVIAGLCAVATLIPLAVGYARIRAFYALGRSFEEVQLFSADVTSLFVAHSTSWLWGWTARWGRPEGELFPGLTIVLLVVAGTALAWARRVPRERLDRISGALLPLAAVAAAVAYCGWVYAPWRFAFAGLTMSSDSAFKSATLALVLVAIWLGLSSRLRGAYARRSTLAFYGIATVVLFVCSLGPKPTLAGHQFLYQAPYALLMHLWVFESIRAPARFGMLVMLSLATTGAIAFDRLRLQPAARRALLVIALAGIAADGWIGQLTLPALPDLWTASRADGFAAVLELPLGDTFGDLAAIYRAIDHRHFVINGNSGFEPAHYLTLRLALEEHDPSTFDGLPIPGRVLVVVDKRADPQREWDRFLTAQPRVTRLADDGRWMFYALDPPPAEAAVCSGDLVPIQSVTDVSGRNVVSALTDGNVRTRWNTSHPQRVGDTLLIDLGRLVRPCAVSVAVGEFRNTYARKLIVETSADAAQWTTVASRRMAGPTIRAALTDPRHIAVALALAPSTARFVRLRLDEAHPRTSWTVTELEVRSAGAGQ